MKGILKLLCIEPQKFFQLEAVSNNKDGREGHKNKRSSETIAAGDDKDSMRNKWKSGYVIVNDRKNDRLRNDPWWMREEEKNNPRMLPEYKPFWRINRQKIIIGTHFLYACVLSFFASLLLNNIANLNL